MHPHLRGLRITITWKIRRIFMISTCGQEYVAPVYISQDILQNLDASTTESCQAYHVLCARCEAERSCSLSCCCRLLTIHPTSSVEMQRLVSWVEMHTVSLTTAELGWTIQQVFTRETNRCAHRENQLIMKLTNSDFRNMQNSQNLHDIYMRAGICSPRVYLSRHITESLCFHNRELPGVSCSLCPLRS